MQNMTTMLIIEPTVIIFVCTLVALVLNVIVFYMNRRAYRTACIERDRHQKEDGITDTLSTEPAWCRCVSDANSMLSDFETRGTQSGRFSSCSANRANDPTPAKPESLTAMLCYSCDHPVSEHAGLGFRGCGHDGCDCPNTFRSGMVSVSCAEPARVLHFPRDTDPVELTKLSEALDADGAVAFADVQPAQPTSPNMADAYKLFDNVCNDIRTLTGERPKLMLFHSEAIALEMFRLAQGSKLLHFQGAKILYDSRTPRDGVMMFTHSPSCVPGHPIVTKMGDKVCGFVVSFSPSWHSRNTVETTVCPIPPGYGRELFETVQVPE